MSASTYRTLDAAVRVAARRSSSAREQDLARYQRAFDSAWWRTTSCPLALARGQLRNEFEIVPIALTKNAIELWLGRDVAWHELATPAARLRLLREVERLGRA